MNSWRRTKALWTHRYYKYTHIAGKYLSFWKKYLQLRWLKLRVTNRPLIAIILSEQMGDIIACEPVAREVRRLHPTGYLIWFVRKPYLELVKDHPALDGYLIEKCPSERIHLIKSGVFDQVYNMHLSHRKCKYCPEDPINPIAEKLNINYNNYYFHGNLLHSFSLAAGLPPLEDQPVLYIPETSKQRVARLNIPPNAIVIHCQSSHILRDWPPPNWNRLVNWLLDTYPYPVIEIGLTPIVQVNHTRFINLCGQLSILETAEVIRQARLFVGIDSGPAHMANATGTEGIILLGQLFDFVDYIPYSGRYKRGVGVTIMNQLGHPCSEMPFEWVQQAVEQRLTQPKLV